MLKVPVLVGRPWFTEVRARSWCFDLDTQWQKEPRYVCYDFNKPCDFAGAQDLKGTFDMVIIDPPFITREAGGVLRTSPRPTFNRQATPPRVCMSFIMNVSMSIDHEGKSCSDIGRTSVECLFLRTTLNPKP